jgi:hypothetical protein
MSVSSFTVLAPNEGKEEGTTRRRISTSDANECREVVVANAQRVAKEKEQIRSKGSRPLETQSKSSKGLGRTMNGGVQDRSRQGNSRGVLVCR